MTPQFSYLSSVLSVRRTRGGLPGILQATNDWQEGENHCNILNTAAIHWKKREISMKAVGQETKWL